MADNVTRLRETRRFTYAKLSALLAENGRRIPPLGLRRLEAGERRVDVDDLLAFARVFNIRPEDLLGVLNTLCRNCFDNPPPGMTCNICGVTGDA